MTCFQGISESSKGDTRPWGGPKSFLHVMQDMGLPLSTGPVLLITLLCLAFKREIY